DFTERQQSKISGNARLTARVKENRSEIRLDLLGLNVDSILFNGNTANFTHNGDSLLIDLNTTVNSSDTFEIQVFYQGTPQQDASGWGGFYFSGNYSYNLGVGFEADPHNYGRVWYPCVDNFTDRATYDFHIKTDTFSKAICNGLLINTSDNGDGAQNWHWQLNQSIPTYLVSVAVADYEFVEYQHSGLQGNIPVLLGARQADTSNLKQSFRHLPDAIDAFEEMLGPYLWDRVGFVLVPFNSGAMEHATNIAYPRTAANGTLNSETLMNHEFAHHWWGNLITCETAEDMWINEGWASYMPILFDEYFYGPERFRKSFRENHREVLQWSHIRDDGYKAISGVSHEYTYGSHVYKKGADVAHTLRAYLKEDYFPCLKDLMEQKAFQNLNSGEFRDILSQCSG
ncbi:MAG: M1 family metallopeptidase, partial [Balneolales bacterium]